MFRKGPVPGVDAELLARDAARLMPDAGRRAFLRGAMSVGSLALLTGCTIVDGNSAEQALAVVSRFNDEVQARLFDPGRLAPTFPESAITRPFPFNAYYPEAEAPEVDDADYALEIGGRVADKAAWTLDQLRALPRESQITRHVCIEGWSAIGRWTGAPLAPFLKRIGADLGARYVGFRCAEGYVTSIDMPSALHPQTQMTFWFDGAPLPRRYGFPMKVRIPTKLGFKNPKHVTELWVTDDYPGGFWEDRGYNWFSGL